MPRDESRAAQIGEKSRLHSLTGRVVRKRGNPETASGKLAGLVTGSRLVFTDEAALRQCRSGWMTRYWKLSG